MPVRYVAGNHDFFLRSEEELKQCWNLSSLFYDFTVGPVRFIVLNGLNESRFSPPESERLFSSRRYKIVHEERTLREWDGKLSESSKVWLEKKLLAADRAG